MAPLPLPIIPRTQPLSPCAPAPRGNRPPWLKVRFPNGENYHELRTLMREQNLHTICEEALCPNIGECWENRTATFLILGDVCTRNCGFCSVTTGRPVGLDLEEPERLVSAVEKIGLRHIVITSVTRDDLPDGGAGIFAETICKLHERVPGCGIEVLIPDFQGNWDNLAIVMAARPDILNHNLETVPRLYRRVRPKAIYEQSLELLRRAKDLAPAAVTKSGLMVGLGETREELEQVFVDLRAHDVDVLTVGQYLRPTMQHLPVERYVTPEEFAELKVLAKRLGFGHVESGPLVRSSYHAHEQVPAGR
ncbi:MAG: lipoyl synthase [Chloroflexota bacterium]|nr:lipoyl synthase [Chloroflexota bacterium]